MFIRSIRTKLTAWYSFVVSVTLIAFGITAYLTTGETLSDNLDRSLSNEATWVREILLEKYPKRKPVGNELLRVERSDGAGTEEKIDSSDEIWNRIYRHVLLNPKVQYIQVKDGQGKTLYKSPTLGEKDLAFPQIAQNRTPSIHTVEFDGAALRMAALKDERLRIYVAYPIEDLNEVLGDLFSDFLFFIPLAVLISIVLGWFLANKSLKPVDEMTRTAQAITAQNLGRTIPHSGANDELGRLASTFNDMISRLRRSFDQIKQFSIDASHELRTPLTIMRGETEIALQSEKTPEEYREVLASHLEEIVRMSSIVENLLTLSKADLGRIELQRDIVPLHEVVQDLYEDSEVLAEKKCITVRLRKLDEVNILGDKARIRQLLLNLIDNAIKYTPERGTVSLALSRANGVALVSVEDTGIGIPSEEISKIFDRFYRVEKGRSRSLGGSGLGLSISKWIAEAHGGKIEVQSEPQRGSTFTVQLPA
jgi:heavy metal sensor kinase